MSLLQWNSTLQLGHAQIDAEHRRLVDLLNALYDAMQAGQGREVCGKILADLVDYTRVHFAAEERLMAQQGYAQTATHKARETFIVRSVCALSRQQ